MIENQITNFKNQKLNRIKKGLLTLQRKHPEAIKNPMIMDLIWMVNELESSCEVNDLLRARIEKLKGLIKIR